MTDTIFTTHGIAHDEDIPDVLELLRRGCTRAIMLQNIGTEGTHSHIPLTDVIAGPYTMEIDDDRNVLHGHNITTGDRKSLRLRGNCGIVQISNCNWKDWYDFGGHGATRLMINRVPSL